MTRLASSQCPNHAVYIDKKITRGPGELCLGSASVIRRFVDAGGFTSSKMRQLERNCRHFGLKSKELIEAERGWDRKNCLQMYVAGTPERSLMIQSRTPHTHAEKRLILIEERF